MPGQRSEGLLGQGMATGDGLHLYHATKAAVVAHTAGDIAKFKADGYGEEYVPQEYPKYLASIDKTATSAEHEGRLLAAAKPGVAE